MSFTFPILYQAAGAGSLLFLVLVTIFEIFTRRRAAFPVAVTALLSGMIVPWIMGAAVHGLDPGVAYGRFLVLDSGIWREWPFVIVLYLFFPAVLALGLRWPGSLDRRNFTPWCFEGKKPEPQSRL